MEFLFWNQIASFESLVVLICVALIGSLFLYDAYLFIARLIGVLTPRKEYVKEKNTEQDKREIPIEEIIQIETTTEDATIVPDTNAVNKESEILIDSIITDWKDTIIQKELSEEVFPPETVAEMNIENMNLPGDWDYLDHNPSHSSEALKTPEGITPVPEDIDPIHDEKLIESILPEKESEKVIPEKLIPEKPTPILSPEKREKLVEITNNTRTLVARGQLVEARALIIEWLSLSKEHRELNIILAELYERDHAFEKAEYIYKDLAHIYTDDAEILLHLANSLAMQRKYRVSYELYKKVLSLQWDSEEVLYTLAHLASELTEVDEAYEYSRNYIRQYPKNPEILWLYSQSQITRGNRRDAIETLIKLKNLTPYNQEIIDLIQKLVVEEEMAGNFWGEK